MSGEVEAGLARAEMAVRARSSDLTFMFVLISVFDGGWGVGGIVAVSEVLRAGLSVVDEVEMFELLSLWFVWISS